MSNFDEDDELQPSIENELQEINKDASPRTKMLVESIIAKFRKCLIKADQEKKLYQMVSIYT